MRGHKVVTRATVVCPKHTSPGGPRSTPAPSSLVLLQVSFGLPLFRWLSGVHLRLLSAVMLTACAAHVQSISIGASEPLLWWILWKCFGAVQHWKWYLAKRCSEFFRGNCSGRLWMMVLVIFHDYAPYRRVFRTLFLKSPILVVAVLMSLFLLI